MYDSTLQPRASNKKQEVQNSWTAWAYQQPIGALPAVGRALHSVAKNSKGCWTRCNNTMRCRPASKLHLTVMLYFVPPPLLFFALLCSALPTALLPASGSPDLGADIEHTFAEAVTWC